MPGTPLPPHRPEPVTYFGGFDRRPTRAATQLYMNCDCTYFALALNAVAGWRIVHLGAHMAARSPDGAYWDVRGRMTREQLMDNLGGDGEVTEITPAEAKAELETGYWSDGPFVPSRLAKAKEAVRSLAGSSLPSPRPSRVSWSVEMLDRLDAMSLEDFSALHAARNASEKTTRSAIAKLAEWRERHAPASPGLR